MALPSRGFRTPPEVTSYFDGKIDRPGFSWLDVWAQEHSYAFTVAKAVDAELLEAFRTSIASAIAESRTFDNWRDDVQARLQKLGWWGPKQVADPSGIDPDELVDFSSRRRLETIFHSNMRAARSAGQWERIQRTKRGLPYLLYIRSAASEPRAEHLAFVGIILPVDDPFWSTHFPPNGWGCKCSVRQITRREAEQLLAREPEEGDIVYVDTPPDLGPPRQFRNRRTGEITEIPVGVDPGWHTNPGLSRSRTLIDNLSGKLEAAMPADATRVVEELWSDPFLKLAPKLADDIAMPAGVRPAIAEMLDASGPIVSVPSNAVRNLVGPDFAIEDLSQLPQLVASAPIVLAQEGAVKIAGAIGEAGWRVTIAKSSDRRLAITVIDIGSAERIAFQILDAGLGEAGLTAAGFDAARIAALVEQWRSAQS